MKKWPKVKESILGHMYYAKEPKDINAIIFRDADAIDFLGAIGITRIISITKQHRWAPSLAGAFVTLDQFKTDLPNKLITNSAKKIAANRIIEMNQFSTLLNNETFQENAL